MSPAKDRIGRLYVVATSHLDTQWRWTVRDTIERFLPDTLDKNFALFEKYPFYVLSFEGAFRYRLIREYYPERFERLKAWVAAGRWKPAGSMLDAPDVNIVSPESLIRHILYGNRFFEHEMGVRSQDIFLPDCFGFTWALPSVAVHCGLAGFSSQKLMRWIAPAEMPFDFGVWEGPDGARLPSVLNPGGYGDELEDDPSRSAPWIERTRRAAETHGVALGYRYFGVGDRGGAPDEASLENLARALGGDGELEVIHAGSDRFFRDLTAEETERLPVHRGELQLPTHGTGCWTSQAQMKRWNRRCETLADAAERAACMAAWSGALDYPGESLRHAWEGFLWHQMHDDLTGTSIPTAYHLSWNDQLLALNRFSTVLTDAVTALARSLDTDVPGVPLVVYNPVADRRQDVVEARVRFADAAPPYVRVVNPEGHRVPVQILARDGSALDIAFLAEMQPLSLGVFSVEATSEPPAAADGLQASATGLENRRYRVAVSQRGEVDSIFDKRLQRELLAAPVALQLLPDFSRRWPAWEMRYKDVVRQPRRWRGPVRIAIEENGPARVALRIESACKGSTLVQHLRLAAGEAGDRLDWTCDLDWRTRRRILKVAFPLAVENRRASYDLGLGVIERANNNRAAYEVPAQRWVDLSSPEAGWGVSILTNGGYGWDKPDDRTVRHTLVRSPLARHHFRHQSHQDFGRHHFTFSLVGHDGDWTAGATPAHGARVNQPLLAFQTEIHGGAYGRQFSFAEVDDPAVEVAALKRIEDPTGDQPEEWVVRLAETYGTATSRVGLRVGGGLETAREIDGCEIGLRPAEVREGWLETELAAFQPRAFALRLAAPKEAAPPLPVQTLELAWDHAATSFHGQPGETDFDGLGNSLPGELLPGELCCGEIPFRLGPIAPAAANALVCRGQEILLPTDTDVLYLLAAVVGEEDVDVEVAIGDHRLPLTLHPYSGFIGQKNRWPQYRGWRTGPEEPAYFRSAPVAWAGTHRHGPGVSDQAYVFCYLYRYEVPLPPGVRIVSLPDYQPMRLFAATAARRGATALEAASRLFF